MKTSYINLYTADLLAMARHLTPAQIGRLIVSICEDSFGQNPHFEPQTTYEKIGYQRLKTWQEQTQKLIKQRKLSGRKGGLKTQQKRRFLDESKSTLSA